VAVSEVASPAATLTRGSQVGNYVVDKKIGEGGMGAVYVAMHPQLGRRVAIKVLLPEHSKQPDLVTRFFNEAKTAANLRHPALVDVFDFGQLPDGAAYLVMDFLEGESLAGRLARSKRLTPQEAVEIGRQLAAGVGAAHGQGIVHRDLKPDNVFLVPDPENPGRERVKILDFGIAKLVLPNAGLGKGSQAVRTSTGMLLGTPLYMAPEQCRGAGQVDHRADIYSVGCILFVMLTGRPPFNHEGVGEVLAAHLHEPVPPPRSLQPDIPPALEAVVVRALDKKPEARFQTMAELAAELQKVPAAPRVPESEPMRLPRQRRGGLIALAAVAVLGAGGVYWWSQRQRPDGAVVVGGNHKYKEGAPPAGSGSGSAPSAAGAAPPAGTTTGSPTAAAGTGSESPGEGPAPSGGGAEPAAVATGNPPAGSETPSSETPKEAGDANPAGGTPSGHGGRPAHAGPSGQALYQKAIDQRARGKEAEALLTLRAALAAGGLTEQERKSAETQSIGLKRKFAELEVICDLDGAQVAVDGRVQGRTPLRRPLLLKPGRRTLAITRAGYRTIMRAIDLKAEERLTLRFSVQR
jgi:serine/threonine-protein kinase